MTHESDIYRGREQSYIKHLFLSRYLKEAAFKIFQGRSRVFNFVDAFAGPWNVADRSGYSDTSFDQAIRTLDEVRSYLGEIGRGDFHIRFFLCEERKNAVRQLRQYAKEKENYDIHVFHGKFENNLAEISAACTDGFTFTFIDPTGWNIDSLPILDFLREVNGEFILNYMAEHVNRHAGFNGVQKSFIRFLASPDWREKFNALPSSWNSERKILYLLRKKIKSKNAAKYVPQFQIMKPGQERVKMRLLLGTNSFHGVEVFRNVQLKIELEETKLRKRMDEDLFGGNLFPMEEIAQDKQDFSGMGSAVFQDEAKNMIIDLLSRDTSARFRALAVKIMEELPMCMKHIKTLLKNMKGQGSIVFNLPPGKKVPQQNTIIRLPR